VALLGEASASVLRKKGFYIGEKKRRGRNAQEKGVEKNRTGRGRKEGGGVVQYGPKGGNSIKGRGVHASENRRKGKLSSRREGLLFQGKKRRLIEYFKDGKGSNYNSKQQDTSWCTAQVVERGGEDKRHLKKPSPVRWSGKKPVAEGRCINSEGRTLSSRGGYFEGKRSLLRGGGTAKV